ncbi:hypothetical protein [Rosistilla oblonga]|uniref:hypothetical protein n=1 Tax=Rosistilla oblonga TaxID=2527990 RepID=UPI003A96C00E
MPKAVDRGAEELDRDATMGLRFGAIIAVAFAKPTRGIQRKPHLPWLNISSRAMAAGTAGTGSPKLNGIRRDGGRSQDAVVTLLAADFAGPKFSNLLGGPRLDYERCGFPDSQGNLYITGAATVPVGLSTARSTPNLPASVAANNFVTKVNIKPGM